MKTNKSFAKPLTSGFVLLNTDDQYLNDLRYAGSIASKTLSTLREFVKNKTSLKMTELDFLAEMIILDHKCEPTFKGFHGFPNAVCISINNELVHGIPKEYQLKEGDIVSFDLGATYNKSIADSAITVEFGDLNKHSLLINSTKECLNKSIEKIEVGKQIGVIGNCINKLATSKGFTVISKYGGHGISVKNGKGIPHAPPFVSNKSLPNEGIRFQKGLVLAVEPLLTTGIDQTSLDSDGWTVKTKNLSAHFEHTLYIHDDYVEVITKNHDDYYGVKNENII